MEKDKKEIISSDKTPKVASYLNISLETLASFKEGCMVAVTLKEPSRFCRNFNIQDDIMIPAGDYKGQVISEGRVLWVRIMFKREQVMRTLADILQFGNKFSIKLLSA